MLIIRKEQLDKLSGILLEKFVAEARQELRQVCPRTVGRLTDAELDKKIRKGVERSASYDITGDRDVVYYVRYMLCYGDDFDTDPSTAWAGKVLRVRNLSGSEKTSRLLKIKFPIEKKN